jgi:hypothetical protein
VLCQRGRGPYRQGTRNRQRAEFARKLHAASTRQPALCCGDCHHSARSFVSRRSL